MIISHLTCPLAWATIGAMDEIWTVSGLNRYIRGALETDYRLKDLVVEGELSNVSRPASGHLYFTLKDSAASIRCVMWKGQAARNIYRPRDGDRVEVRGSIGVYEAGGQYQLYADTIRAAGEGDLFRQFTALKNKLEAEGLFDPGRKRLIPARPQRAVVVTSPTGAALRDILNIFRRRWPSLQVILCPTAVQGDDAPAQIVRAIAAANSVAPDVIIVARGGGSIEDLWAFNDESVARAVAASAAPLISGVGHETDFTLCDFAADARAPTPSAAAELATPNRAVLATDLRGLTARLAESMSARLREQRWALAERAAALRGLSPRAQLTNSRQRLDDLQTRSAAALQHRLTIGRERLAGLAQRLQSLNPLAVLQRGYAVVTRAGTAEVVRSPAAVSAGEALDVRVSEGAFTVRVDSPQRREDTKEQRK
ncbi:MAG: exodeoxyribonuclease VII large subunit [Chloroflexi bacterium]|nr:exodeoxyribonuclease VII large subunit [Chloroflexota bacterium]